MTALRTLTIALLMVATLPGIACGTPLVEVPPPELNNISQVLGYSLAPTRMPECFDFEQFKILGNEPGMLTEPWAGVWYERCQNYAYHNILFLYP